MLMEISLLLTITWMAIEKPLSIMKNIWKMQWNSMNGVEKEEPMKISLFLISGWMTIKKPLSMMKNIWRLQ